MRLKLTILFLFVFTLCKAQYSFSGYIEPNEWQNTVYLSVVEDYRKISGVYAEQIIAKTTADATGYFEFKGNMLEAENRIYRIHIDKCSEATQDANHFNGHCSDSKEIIFIANNTDTLKLPFSFENQVFCYINSTNDKATAFVRIDSLKADMRFAYGEFRSEANRKLNNKKWFKTLQDFGKFLNEPLAELYIYSYLSDRTSDLHSYYVEDLKTNNYYENLNPRLAANYPEGTDTKQYENELNSDLYMLNTQAETKKEFNWLYIVLVLLFVSVLLNIYFVFQNKKSKKQSFENLKQRLSKQERVVLGLILQNKTNKDIAETLFISVNTIKTHTNSIYKS
ncbi:MAG: helix-turn-helix transcriptional regulator [Winogradskyella sp.]|uniref:helix-turn-helix domain-containing protein n=1 Tax=Winogradskyella sp. TaxID=1883156 RepID=UPI0017B65A48|nr:helix-turn-helix transcriptional regulator [Winogradskyella sp.]MBT8246018.1 helix-turn-helix transcriptional regulator [Winogradskyella sp.]NNK21917.1 helix-turn-helix transcriptional regulator [Winogradskyella sp.]